MLKNSLLKITFFAIALIERKIKPLALALAFILRDASELYAESNAFARVLSVHQ